jgi:hypothetical protein
MMSAYKNAYAGRVVVVVINRAEREYVIELECVNATEDLSINSWIPYDVTDADNSLAAHSDIAEGSNIEIPPSSVAMLVSSGVRH